MEKADYQQLNGIALAYLGDAVYEVFIRQHLLALGMSKPNRLQHQATHYVSAKAQAALIDLMKADELLTEDEWSYFKRGRNLKPCLAICSCQDSLSESMNWRNGALSK